MLNYKNDSKFHPFLISADDGYTWTEQFMTYNEVINEFVMGHIVRYRVMQKCENCGALFYVEYWSDGSYNYMNDACDCESEFHPYFSNEPTLSEFMSMFNKESYNRKNYTYKVCLCDGHYCDGHITVRADDEDEAYEMVMDYVLGGLAKALPELGIDVSIELED